MAIRGMLVSMLMLAIITDARAQETAAPGRFVVATYNINYGNADLPGVVATIRKSGADVVALQETNRRSERVLRRELGKTWPHMSFHTARAAGGFAILSKTPLEKVRTLPPAQGAGGWFGTQTVRVTLVGREVMIVNVHLMPATPSRNMDVRGLMARYVKTDAVREKEIRAIVDALPKRWPVFVLGDFNSIPNLSGVPGFMAKSGFTDCPAEVVRDADSVHTWHWNLRGIDYGARLDYLFSARVAAKPVSGVVIESGASDHYLVTCTFETLPIPVELGLTRTEALNVVYLLDPVDMTSERAAAARKLVAASIAKLSPMQNLCTAVVGRKDLLVPSELSPATPENRTTAARALPREVGKPDPLASAVEKAMTLLADEAAPKVLFILSDRLAKDPLLLKSVRALHTDRRVQLLLLDAEGNPIAVAGVGASDELEAFPAIPCGHSPERTELCDFTVCAFLSSCFLPSWLSTRRK